MQLSGIQTGDIVLQVDGQTLLNVEDLIRAVTGKTQVSF